jgi:hypothetical protein
MADVSDAVESTDAGDPGIAEERASGYKMTPERVAKYLDSLRAGNRRGMAARAAGITRDTVWRWRRLDPDFAHDEAQAELDAHEDVEDALYQAAISGNVTAIQVWLYNRMPDRWRDQRNLSVAGPGGGPIEHAVTTRRYDAMTDDELASAEQEAATRLADEARAAVDEAERILRRPKPRSTGKPASRGGRAVRDPPGEGPA